MEGGEAGTILTNATEDKHCVFSEEDSMIRDLRCFAHRTESLHVIALSVLHLWLILTHPRKMLIPQKCSHSKSSSKNTGSKVLKSSVQSRGWSSWGLTERWFVLKSRPAPPRLAPLPCYCPTARGESNLSMLAGSCCTQTRRNLALCT